MRNSLKRVTAICLSMLLLLPSYAFAGDEASALIQMQEGRQAIGENEFPKAIEIEAGFLNTLDMIPEGVDFASHITREEAAVLLCKMLAREDFAKSISDVSYYEDVSVYSKNVGYINVVTHEGLFSGRSERIFDPSAAITYAEFCKILVSATGYGVAAESKGGYPDGYTKLALQLKIATAVPVNTFVTWGDAVKMVYEAMQIDVLAFDGLSTNGNYEISKVNGQSILNTNHEIYWAKGQITGTALCRIFGTGVNRDLESDEIEIEGRLYKYNREKLPHVDRLTGYNTEYFYRKTDTDEYELVYVHVKDAQVMELMSYEIREVYGFNRGDNGSAFIKYYIDEPGERKNKKVTLDDELALIVNNETIPRITNEALFPSCGKVVLIDANNDNSYDVALVTEYVTQVVDIVSIYDKHIFFKNDPTTTPLVLNPIYNDVTYDIVQDGEYISLNMLREGDVIGIIESTRNDKPYYLIELLSSMVKGTVESIGDDEVVVDGVSYGVSEGFDPALYGVGPGEVCELYFDFANELFYAEVEEEGYNFQYILINAGMTRSLGGMAQLKVCYAAGNYGKKVEILDCAERVKVNGKMREGKEILDALRLNSADTAVMKDYEFLRPLKWVEFDDEGKVKLIDTVEMSSTRESRTYQGNGAYDEAFGEEDISYKTQICYIPNTMRDEDWVYSELNKMKFGTSFDSLMWGRDEENLPEAVFVWHNRTSEDPSFMIDYNRPMIIKSIKNVYDSTENDYVYKVETMNVGSTYTYSSDSRNTANQTHFASLKKGDVIFAALTKQSSAKTPKVAEILGGNMWNCEKVISLDEENLTFYKSSDNMYGRVKTIRIDPRANECFINMDLGEDGEQSYNVSGVPIYYFDRGENTVTVATYAAVRSSEIYGEDGASNIFVCLDDEFDPNMVVIVGEK